MKKLVISFFVGIPLVALLFVVLLFYYGGLNELFSSQLFHPHQVDSLKTIANKNGIASFWINSLNDSAILRNKIEEKRHFEKEIKQLSEELKSLESDVHLIEMVVSMKSKDEPTYSLDVLENHFIQNEMYLGKHKDIKRELDMKYEQIKRLKENIYSRQRFIDNLSSQK